MNAADCVEEHSRVNRLVDLILRLAHGLDVTVSSGSQDLGQDRIKVVRHRKRFSDFLLGRDAEIVPITFEIWPSLTCDARCALCTYTQNAARMEADASSELFLADVQNTRRLLEELADSGVNSIIWTGGGEPTLHPDLIDLVTWGQNAGLEWGLFTHGYRLSQQLGDSLLTAEPRFVRISVNAGSSAGHEREYHLGGGAYEVVKENLIRLAKSDASGSARVGAGYALSPSIQDAELDGIVQFLSEVFERSGGRLGFAAFRPKVLFYRNGAIADVQPRAMRLGELVSRIEERVIARLRERFNTELRLDFKAGMFLALADQAPPERSLATGWAGAADHRGCGYILSELNGSPWPGACYGDFVADGFRGVWDGRRRRQLAELYSSGERLAPAHHKLRHVDALLLEIRDSIGILTGVEVDDFYKHLDEAEIHWPRNWDFL